MDLAKFINYIATRKDDWAPRGPPAANTLSAWSWASSQQDGMGDMSCLTSASGECIREWDKIKAAHPTIRGMFCWSAQTNLNAGNVWSADHEEKARMRLTPQLPQ